MSPLAQRRTADARPDGHEPHAGDAWRSSSQWAAEVLSGSNVVAFVADSGTPVPQEAPAEPTAVDWPAALDLIRDVGARVRRARDFAQEVARHSQSIIQRSLKQAEDAERRAEVAEAAATAAIARAEKAEAIARLSEARAKLAEKQAEEAKAGEAEAQMWARRVLACLGDELDELTVDPA